MNKHTTLPQLLLGIDEGIKEIRELLKNDVERGSESTQECSVHRRETRATL